MSNNKITVKVVEAKDLKAADIGGTSDPFCTLRLVSPYKAPSNVHKTRVIKKTLCPTWNEEYTFISSMPREDTIEIKVYDYDTFSNNDLLGVYNLPVGSAIGRNINEWFDLRDPKNTQRAGKGQIHLIVTYSGEGAPKPGAPGAPGAFGAYPPPGAPGAYPPPGAPGAYPPPGAPMGAPPMGAPPMGAPPGAPPPMGAPMAAPMGAPPMGAPMGAPPMGAPMAAPMAAPMGAPPMGAPMAAPMAAPMGAPMAAPMGVPPMGAPMAAPMGPGPMMGGPVPVGGPAPMMGGAVMAGPPMMGGPGGAPPGYYYNKKGKLKQIKHKKMKKKHY